MNKRERADAIEEMRTRGKTLEEIGKEFGITRERVRQICSELGIEKPVRKRKEKPKRDLKDRYVSGEVAWCRERGLKNPRDAFSRARSNAARRGIEWKLTFSEWWGYWKENFSNMGRMSGDMCMCRTLDMGGYEVGNVRVDYVRSKSRRTEAFIRDEVAAANQARRM